MKEMKINKNESRDEEERIIFIIELIHNLNPFKIIEKKLKSNNIKIVIYFIEKETPKETVGIKNLIIKNIEELDNHNFYNNSCHIYLYGIYETK
jgi:hypothetical protein